jgi:hypothetical protein
MRRFFPLRLGLTLLRPDPLKADLERELGGFLAAPRAAWMSIGSRASVSLTQDTGDAETSTARGSIRLASPRHRRRPTWSYLTSVKDAKATCITASPKKNKGKPMNTQKIDMRSGSRWSI